MNEFPKPIKEIPGEPYTRYKYRKEHLDNCKKEISNCHICSNYFNLRDN